MSPSKLVEVIKPTELKIWKRPTIVQFLEKLAQYSPSILTIPIEITLKLNFLEENCTSAAAVVICLKYSDYV